MTVTKKAPRRAAKKKAAKKKAPAKKAKKKAAKKKATKAKKKDGDAPLSLAERRDKIRARYERPVVIYEDDADQVPVHRSRFPRFNRLVGGLRAGAILELYGPEDSGKSSESIALAADIQASAPEGKNHVVLVNYEGPEPWRWWRTLGLRTDKAHFTQLRPKTLEEGIGDMADLVQSGEVCAVIIDSVYAAEAKAGRDMLKSWQDPKAKTQGKGGMAVEARAWGTAWTAIKGIFQEFDCVCIAVNQVREVIDAGGRPTKGYSGPKLTSPRGKALKFYAWVRLELRGLPLIDDSGDLRKDVDGRRVRMRVIKCKTSDEPRGTVEYDLIRGVGFDVVADLIQCCLDAGAIKHRGGGHYECGKHKIRGKAALRAWVEGSDHVRGVLEQVVDKWLAKQEIEDIVLEVD